MAEPILIPDGPPDGWRLGAKCWWECWTEAAERGALVTIDGVDFEAPKAWEPSLEGALDELAWLTGWPPARAVEDAKVAEGVL